MSMARAKSEPETLPVPVSPARQDVIEREQAVVAQIDAILERRPEAISWDVADCANEGKTLRAQTDPGVPAAVKDGWRGFIVDWWIGVWETADPNTRVPLVLPCLALISRDDQLVRLTGWPAISAWGTLLRAAGIQRMREGIPVVVRRRPSGTVGHSYWVVLPDWNQLKQDKEGA